VNKPDAVRVFGGLVSRSGLRDRRRVVASCDGGKSRRRWTGPEKAQVVIGVLGLILALVAIVVQ
jgi:hypothetical protein